MRGAVTGAKAGERTRELDQPTVARQPLLAEISPALLECEEARQALESSEALSVGAHSPPLVSPNNNLDTFALQGLSSNRTVE